MKPIERLKGAEVPNSLYRKFPVIIIVIDNYHSEHIYSTRGKDKANDYAKIHSTSIKVCSKFNFHPLFCENEKNHLRSDHFITSYTNILHHEPHKFHNEHKYLLKRKNNKLSFFRTSI